MVWRPPWASVVLLFWNPFNSHWMADAMSENTLKARITDDMKTAMKARDAARLSSIRLLLAAIKQREVDERKDLSDAEVAAEVDAAISATGATGAADMGKVMGIVKGKLAGRADMGKVSALVKSKLTGN